jgi:hypothetical protein
MSDAAKEAWTVVGDLLSNLRPIAEKHPGEMMSATEFNAALRLAKKAFSGSATIQEMKEMRNDMGHERAKAIDVVSRLAALDGAINTARS